MFGIVVVSLHVGIVNVFVFHAICIPISTLTHSGKMVAASQHLPTLHVRGCQYTYDSQY